MKYLLAFASFTAAAAIAGPVFAEAAITGIAVPGMPMGEPGMEMTPVQDPLTSYAFVKGGGEPTVYSVD